MRGLDALRQLHGPDRPPEPVEQLLGVAKTFGEPTVAKRRSPDHVREVPLTDLQVDYAYQRPPDRHKIHELVQHLKTGGTLPAIQVNQRNDGSLWIEDGQHRAAAAALCGRETIPARITHKPSGQEDAKHELVKKVAADRNSSTIELLLGAGARIDGKRLILDLGPGREVTYVPTVGEWVGRTERGLLRVTAPDARKVTGRLGLSHIADTGDPALPGLA